MTDIYLKLSRKYGTILEWFPAGGGNISVKENNYIYIKKSGTAVVDGLFLKCDMNNIDENEMPSIEIWFHLFMKKYTIHMHPFKLGELLNQKLMIDNDETIYIDYVNPGKELADKIQMKYNNHSIIFLINHGIIFTSDSIDELHELIRKTLIVDDSLFEIQENTDKLVWKSNHNLNIGKLNYYIPDIPIYLGYEVIDSKDINNYISNYNTYPVLINYNNQLFIIANNKKKFYDIEEMIVSYIYLSKSNMKTIDDNDIYKLMNWDKEIYRQAL